MGHVWGVASEFTFIATIEVPQKKKGEIRRRVEPSCDASVVAGVCLLAFLGIWLSLSAEGGWPAIGRCNFEVLYLLYLLQQQVFTSPWCYAVLCVYGLT